MGLQINTMAQSHSEINIVVKDPELGNVEWHIIIR